MFGAVKSDETQLATPDTRRLRIRVGLSHSHSVPKTGAQIGITKPLSNQPLTNFQMRGQNQDVSRTDSPGQDVTFRIPDEPLKRRHIRGTRVSRQLDRRSPPSGAARYTLFSTSGPSVRAVTKDSLISTTTRFGDACVICLTNSTTEACGMGLILVLERNRVDARASIERSTVLGF